MENKTFADIIIYSFSIIIADLDIEIIIAFWPKIKWPNICVPSALYGEANRLFLLFQNSRLLNLSLHCKLPILTGRANTISLMSTSSFNVLSFA